jgi:hypothetical protein
VPDAWPKDQIEHEMRSLRRNLRTYTECPDEFRINEYEGGFIRPSVRLVLVTAGMERNGHAVISNRSMTLVWFGTDSDDIPFIEGEARSALDWIVQSLTRGNEQYFGGIPIYDWSTPNSPSATRFVINIDNASVSGQMIRDESGLYSIPVDFRYTVSTVNAHTISAPTVIQNIYKDVEID